jgi:YD repeat-containing protein
LRTRKRPQEDAATTYDYYDDDRLQHSIDARNAEGTLTYYARGLLKQATYVTPGNVAPTSTVEFKYDENGARTEMDDGPGKVTYQYDSLNRLIGETRTFDALANQSFALSYAYNLAGQLTAMTDFTSNTISYARDKIGRMTAITGTPYGGVTSYASGIQYRAWGAPKAVSYGSGFTASAKFNVRLQVSEFDIPGVIGGAYTYNDDRQLSAFVASTPQYQQYDTRMNRTFGYDEFGRMNSSVAGGSGFYATFNPQQDAFGNVTNSSYHYWQNGQTATTFTATYQNNRVTSVSDNGLAQTWNYDAMGNRTGIVKTSDNTTLESIAIDSLGRGVAAGVALDGEGQAVITGGGGNFYLRSTVFGGEIVTTLSNTGNKQEGRVLDGVSLIAEQIGSTVRWHHRDPLNLVARDTEPGQVKRRVHAVTPNGAQIETSEGVDLNQYYGCAAGGYNPNCTGYNPQAAAAYGYLANQANGLLAGGIKVDGALTSRSLSDIARQIQRTGVGSILLSTALFGTPMGASIGVTAGSWQKREVWHEKYSWGKDGFSTTTTAVNETTFEWVPGGEGIGADFGLTDGQQKTEKENPNPDCDKIIASIFGGPGAVVATNYDISGSYRNDEIDHMASKGVFHIYTNKDGTKASVGLYAPSGWINKNPERPRIPKGASKNDTDLIYHSFVYPDGYTINFVHPGGRDSNGNLRIDGKDVNTRGTVNSIRIGTIGGPGGGGGDWERGNTNYNHTHIRIRETKTGKPLDPRDIFCKGWRK